MYHMITTEDRAHLCRGQHGREWQITPESTDLAAPALRSIQCREQQRGFPSADGVANPLESGNGKPSPARKPDRIAAALRQQRLDAIRQPRRQR
jgi:hypothetical protein